MDNPTHTNTVIVSDTVHCQGYQPLCEEYHCCEVQNGVRYGAVPFSPIKIFTGEPTYWERIPGIIQAHRLIRQSGLSNFLGFRIPVSTQLKVDKWRSHLANYFDQQLVDLIEYGFPLDFDRNRKLGLIKDNHTSAIHNPSHIGAYIREELSFGAILGPLHDQPFPIHISPFMTWEKSSSEFQLHYPSVDDIVHKLNTLGPAAKIFKVDISMAFCHVCIDPGDIHLLVLQYNNSYHE